MLSVQYFPFYGATPAYVASWIKILKGDPKEILRASRDAEQIHRYMMALEKGRVLPEQEFTHKDTIDRLAPTKIPHRVASRGR